MDATRRPSRFQGRSMDANEEILTLSGKVTGSVRVVWQPHCRAYVTDGGYGQDHIGTLTFKGKDYRVSYVDFRRTDDGAWTFEPRGTSSPPIRKGTSSFNDAAPATYMRAMLDAIADALKGAHTVEKSRSANLAAIDREIERAEREEAELLGKLTEERERLRSLRTDRKLYVD